MRPYHTRAEEIKVSTLAGAPRPPVPLLKGSQSGIISLPARGLAASLNTLLAVPKSSPAPTTPQKASVLDLETSTSSEQYQASQKQSTTLRERLRFIWNTISHGSQPQQRQASPQPSPQPHIFHFPASSMSEYHRALGPITEGPLNDTQSPPQILSGGDSEVSSKLSVDQLPDELLLHIMEYLDPTDLYILRQTSSVFARLFKDRLFAKYHGYKETRNGHVHFSMASLPKARRRALVARLQRDMFCTTCIEARYSSNWASRLSALQEMVHCDGCERSHPKMFFFAEDIVNRKTGCEQLLCVGRLGRVSLCSHRTPRTTATWRSFPTYGHDISVCTHPSHQPVNSVRKNSTRSALPWMTLSSSNLAYWWDLSLLELDQGDMPALDAIQEALCELIGNALYSHRVCKHLTRDGRLRNFVRSGICECFTRLGHCPQPFTKDETPDCFCDRERYLTCRDCGAACAWFLEAGLLGLSYRYIWDIKKPTSPAWLTFLDEDSYRDQLFKEDTRNILVRQSAMCCCERTTVGSDDQAAYDQTEIVRI